MQTFNTYKHSHLKLFFFSLCLAVFCCCFKSIFMRQIANLRNSSIENVCVVVFLPENRTWSNTPLVFHRNQDGVSLNIVP